MMRALQVCRGESLQRLYPAEQLQKRSLEIHTHSLKTHTNSYRNKQCQRRWSSKNCLGSKWCQTPAAPVDEAAGGFNVCTHTHNVGPLGCEGCLGHQRWWKICVCVCVLKLEPLQTHSLPQKQEAAAEPAFVPLGSPRRHAGQVWFVFSSPHTETMMKICQIKKHLRRPLHQLFNGRPAVNGVILHSDLHYSCR